MNKVECSNCKIIGFGPASSANMYGVFSFVGADGYGGPRCIHCGSRLYPMSDGSSFKVVDEKISCYAWGIDYETHTDEWIFENWSKGKIECYGWVCPKTLNQ